MAEAVLSCVLSYLRDLTIYHIDLLRDAEYELQYLREDLEHMQSLLKEAADLRTKGAVLKNCEKHIRYVIYKAEDIIDLYVTRAFFKEKKRERRFPVNFSIPFFSGKTTLAQDVKRIREKDIKNVVDKMQKAMQLDQTPNEADQEPTRAASRIREADRYSYKTIVGFEDVIDECSSKLKTLGSKPEVIPIVAMAGSGKTTVACKLFYDPSIIYEVSIKIWLSVTDEPCRKDIYLRLLNNFTREDTSHLNENELLDKVREHLETVAFLLVVDDVWTTETWLEIDRILSPLINRSFKVLVTTRDKKVAHIAASLKGDIYNLRKLDVNESWKLLQLKVYGDEETWPKELEDVGKKIAKGCDGLPLALVVIGGILLMESSSPAANNRNYFENVSNNVHKYMLSDDKGKAVEEIIKLSYDKLPYDLRDCLLYLGVFPAGYHFSTWKLKCLWIGEGLVMQEVGSAKGIEEIADDYVEELVSRNLVTVVERNVEEKVKKCYVHGTIREYCKKVGGFEQQQLLQEISKSRDTGGFIPDVSNIANFRRIYIHSGIFDLFEQKKLELEKARSFVCFPKERMAVPLESVSSILNRFELLRVFEGSSLKFPAFPQKLNQLIHLRYLALAAEKNFTKLPKTIDKLWRLQTLVIDTDSHAFKIEVDLSHMPQLRYMKTKGTLIVKSSEENKYLQTLGRISVDSCNAKLLSNAKYIKTLGIRGKLDPLMNDDSPLKTSEHLVKLKLIHTGGEALPLLPECFPAKLKILTLSKTNLSWDNMATLGKLEHLEVLKLKEYAFEGEEWDYNGKGFVSLRYLQVENSDLKTWEISQDSFSHLKYLSLKSCNELTDIPTIIKESLDLHTLEIESATRLVLLSAKIIEDRLKSMKRKFELLLGPKDQKVVQELAYERDEMVADS